MTNYNSKTNRKAKKLSGELIFRFTTVAILFIAFTVVCLMAFVKIENNLSALSVFVIGMLINAVLCYSGLTQKLY